jgi:hypothetical protein
MILGAETGVSVPQQQSLSGATFVAMMQPTDLWEGNNLAFGRWAYGPGLWTILVEREMRPRPMIVLNIRRQGAAQVMLIENDNVIKTLAPDVRPAKAGVFSRSQTSRGKSQAPRSLDGRLEGNQDSEAHRQGLPRGDHESPGRNESERKSGLESG